MAITSKRGFFNPPPKQITQEKDQYSRDREPYPKAERCENPYRNKRLNDREVNDVDPITDIAISRRIKAWPWQKRDTRDHSSEPENAQRFQVWDQ